MKKFSFLVSILFLASCLADINQISQRTIESMNKSTEVATGTEDTDKTPEQKLVGIWYGSYGAGQGETGLTLRVHQEGGGRKATFHFYNLPGRTNAAEGSFNMNVSYDQKTRKYYLEAYEWIERPSGYVVVNLEGTLTGTTFSGNVIGGSSFHTKRSY